MKERIKAAFGITPIDIKKLNGYENENYLITTATKKYIFKTYPSQSVSVSLLEAECSALMFLQKPTNNLTPTPIPFITGEYVKLLSLGTGQKICRMLSFLPGSFLGDQRPSKKLIFRLGSFLAKINLKLNSFESDAIRARTYEWDLQNLLLNKKYIPSISEIKTRRVVGYFFQQFEQLIVPELPSLRKAYIHSDFNEWNVMVREENAAGLIDFGDMVYSPLVNEVATALAYITYDKESFFEWATPFLEAYHEKNPLTAEEVSLLYYLIATKLCISICQSANARVLQPENKYASLSEKNAIKMLHFLLTINPIAVDQHFLTALGLEKKERKDVSTKLAEREQHLSRVLSVSYQEPIFMNRSVFQYMYDGYGNTFLDAYNNIPHVGHAHPKVVEAGQRQMSKLNTNTRYLYDLLPEYAEKLLAKFPKKLNKVFFVNSGSEANDLAIRIAKKHTGNKNIVVLEHGYHGHTQTGIDISDYKFNNPKGQGQKDHIIKAPLPKEYQGKFGKGASAGALYAKEVIDQINRQKAPIAAFISEPIVGCGGQVPLAPGYLQKLYPEIRKNGGLCISDEVQTGFGRLGSTFWGYEQHGVEPDIVVVGKPMGNGHPIGAVITSSEIAASFAEGVEFFSSFGGNPVSCAIGAAVLDVIEEEGLQENALKVGLYYKSLFTQLQSEDPRIGDVRGDGLFLGVEIVEDGRRPDTHLAQFIKNELRSRNILISTDGPSDNVIKTKPPLVFTKENAALIVEELSRALRMSLKR